MATIEDIEALDTAWLLICGILVFFMQAGFGMLEAGVVNEKNVTNIMFKNLMDAMIAAIVFSAVGYGLAYGDADDGPFIGANNFFLLEEETTSYASFFFQWTFSAAAATIVSGAVAERCKLEAYFVYSVILTAFVYPVVVHWVWDSEGWLCSWKADGKPFLGGDEGFSKSNGMIDFAGCSVVHMVGGVAGLIGAIFLGPRKGRFTGQAYEPHNKLTAAIGVMFLWFGWYGFNCGSTLMLTGGSDGTAARTAVTTTLSASAGGLTGTILSRFLDGHYDIMMVLNGILAGLVSITASCAFIKPGWSLLAGIIGCFICTGTSKLLHKLKIDDPLDAFAVHGATGAWGALNVGIFVTDSAVAEVLGWENKALSSGLQFGVQFIGVLVIFLWTAAWSILMFAGIKYTIGLRVSDAEEQRGLDTSEHGGKAYNPNMETASDDATVTPAGAAAPLNA